MILISILSFRFIETGWDQIWGIFSTLLLSSCLYFYEILQCGKLLRAKLLDDTRQQVLDSLGFWLSNDHEGVALE